MSSSYSSLDWVLSHWVHSLDLFVLICVYFVLLFFMLHFYYVVLLSAQWGGPNGIEAQCLGPLFLQSFDTVGLVFWPIKPVPDMTYNVFGGTLNLAQFNSVRQTDARCMTHFGVGERIHGKKVGLLFFSGSNMRGRTQMWLQRWKVHS